MRARAADVMARKRRRGHGQLMAGRYSWRAATPKCDGAATRCKTVRARASAPAAGRPHPEGEEGSINTARICCNGEARGVKFRYRQG